MGKITEKIILNAGPGTVWKFITAPKNFPKYVYGYAHGKATSPNAAGIGASYEWYGLLGPFKLKSTEEIVQWKKKKYVAYAGKMFGIKFDSSMSVKKIKAGARLAVSLNYSVPLYLGGKITDWFLIRRLVKDYLQKSLNHLKRRYRE